MTNAGLRGHLFVQRIDLSDTDATVAQFSDVFDTPGGKSLGLYMEEWDRLSVEDHISVMVLSRPTGKPWLLMSAFETITDTSGNRAPSQGPEGAAQWPGLFDETVVVVQPHGDSMTPASVQAIFGTGTVDFGQALDVIGADWVNAFSVQFVDPGLPNQRLHFESPDGFTMQVVLATDGDGIITSVTSDIDPLFGAGQPFVLAGFAGGTPDLMTATEVLPLTGGDSGGTGITYSVTGSL